MPAITERSAAPYRPTAFAGSLASTASVSRLSLCRIPVDTYPGSMMATSMPACRSSLRSTPLIPSKPLLAAT
jgi:hypothetical protein